MKNILIVDDQPERHEGFKTIFYGHCLTHAWTYTQAISYMPMKEFDIICLDHDLGDLDIGQDSVAVDSPNFKLSYKPDFTIGDCLAQTKRYYDGRDICQWMVEHLKYTPGTILVHSWNPDGAGEMVKILHHFKDSTIVRRAYGQGGLHAIT